MPGDRAERRLRLVPRRGRRRSSVAPVQPNPASVRLPGPWTHADVSANGIRLHTVSQGDGPLVLLLHGFPEFWWSWRHQLPELAAAGHRAVAVDLRGYGDSDKPPRGYDGWTLAGDIAGLIRALGERDAVIVGHDWGGLLAWTVAALHPRVVRAIVPMGAAHPLAIRRAVVRDVRRQGLASRYGLGFQAPLWPERRLTRDGGAHVESILRAWSGPGWQASGEFAEVVRRNRDAACIPGAAHSALEYYRWSGRSQLRTEGRRFVAAIDRPCLVPVLQLHGADDPCVLESTARLSARWGGTARTYRVLPGVGHFVHEEAPADTTEAVVDFLRDLDDR